MKTVCGINMCAGCMACVNKCPREAINIVDNMKHFNAIIDEKKCIECGLCEKVCPQTNTPEKNDPIKWYEGWTNDDIIRSHSSSGGAAASIAKAFIDDGGYVCSCLFEGGAFIFRITNMEDSAKRFAGSKYVKSNPGNVYKEIDELLKAGRKVLFIGLPCQVAGLKNFSHNNDKLFTVDLICHGTPSAKTLDLFLRQNGIEIKALKNISFRSEAGMGLTKDGFGVSMPGTVDPYLLSFLNALNYTENCYSCKFASRKRISDITLGDNWGTELKNEMRKGVSLILINTNRGNELISKANLELLDVDVERAIAANGQLSQPSKAPETREWFMDALIAGEKYNHLVRKVLPKQYMRQILKGYAVKLHLKKLGGGYHIIYEKEALN